MATAEQGGPRKTDKAMTDKLDRKHLKGESKSTKKAVKKGAKKAKK